jgi:rsbT co-antagonist protein RsbR
MNIETAKTHEILKTHQKDLLEDWLREQASSSAWRPDLITEAELRQQTSEFLVLLTDAMQAGGSIDINSEAWSRVREMLASVSRSRALQGFSPAETATFIFSLKQPLFARLRKAVNNDTETFASEMWHSTAILDRLGLYTTEAFQKSREDVIRRQQQEMLELSTPVVKLWEGVLALPLIGTLDSERTQIIMENLLQKIVETGASIVIIDITGVPTVDTLVAQHLLKTVSAARLMGSDCIISGIRPQIAQTIVHLGVELHEMITKATLADAFVLALQRTGFVISRPTNRT